MLDAATADAWPVRTAATKSATLDAPPLAMTGTLTASATARTSFELVPFTRAFVRNRGDEDFPGARIRHSLRMRDRIAPRVLPAIVRKDTIRSETLAPNINGNHDALASELARDRRNELRVRGRRGIDDDLFYTQLQNSLDLTEIVDSAAEGDRHERLARDLGEQAVLTSLSIPLRPDVQQDELVHPLVVEDPDGVDRISDVGWIFEPNRLDEITVLQEQDGNDPYALHAEATECGSLAISLKLRSRRIPNTWLFSG